MPRWGQHVDRCVPSLGVKGEVRAREMDSGETGRLGEGVLPGAGVSREKRSHQKSGSPASLVAQWLRIRLPMQGTRVRALVWEDPTCRGATKPVRHNY